MAGCVPPPGCVSLIPGVPGEGLEQGLQHHNGVIFKNSESSVSGRGSRDCAPLGPALRRAPAAWEGVRCG